MGSHDGTMKTITIVAGSTLSKSLLRDINKSDLVIGADRGALWLLANRVTPQIALGDFDSVTRGELARIKKRVERVLVFPKKKDVTDLELAIDLAISFRPKEVWIYGALGRRFDHAMAAVHLLLKLSSHNIYGEIVDNFNKMFVVRREASILKDTRYRYISLIPLIPRVRVTLRGFAYDVTKREFPSDSTLGVSNEIRGPEARIEVHGGAVLVIQSRD
jgi:thiamine pyrophosphokinase